MASELVSIAGRCDGVRCDMAMLLLPEVFATTWGRSLPAFWPGAIRGVREARPDFLFMAEVYWDLEWTLQQLGFDACYDKRLYDRVCHGDAASIRAHLSAGLNYQDRLVRFLENHDEPRAAAVVPFERHRAAAVGARRDTDVDAARRHEHITAIGMSLGQRQHASEPGLQSGPQRRRLAIPARRAWAQQDRAFGEHQRRVLHEDRVRELLERGQYLDADPRGCERSAVARVFIAEPLEGRRAAVDRAQPGGHAAARGTHQGGVEVMAHGRDSADAAPTC